MFPYPNRIEDHETLVTLRKLIDFVNSLDSKQTVLSTDVMNIHIPTIAEIQRQLQLGGSASINVTGLLGVLQQAQIAVTEGTHAQRLITAPTVGAAFLETDRRILYFGVNSSGGALWSDPQGTMFDALVNRPSDLGVNDVGFRFVASNTDQNAEYIWTGTEFVTIDYLQEVEDAVTNAVTTLQVLRHLTTGAAAANFGVRQLIQLENSTGSTVDGVAVDSAWDVATAAAETSRWLVFLKNAGAALAEYFRVTTTGIRVVIGGFFGLFTHANTANRTYTFADADGNIVFETSALTNDAVILGNGGQKVKPGATLPADATKFYDGTGAFSTPSGGGGALAFVAYQPGSDSTVGTTTNTTMTAIDGTNVVVTFTAPASGKVSVDVGCLYDNQDGADIVYWGLLDGGGSTVATLFAVSNANTFADWRSATFVVTGLTPSTSYTYKWAHKMSGGAGPAHAYGGPNYGQVIMIVRTL